MASGVPRVWEKIEERIREAGKTTTGLKRTIADWAKAGVAWITGGRILGRNPDKGLMSFPPFYLQFSLQLCLEISISSNSRNLLQFLQFNYCTL
jgi:hypothetical protein